MAVFTVTTLVDENDPSPGGADLSLREALALANADADADDIVFDSTLSGTLALAFGQLTISNSVTINGDSDNDGITDITIDAHGASRIFDISGGTATLGHLNIINGLATGAGGFGGGIYVHVGAAATVVDTTLSGNSAGDSGGGIANLGTLTLINSTLADNDVVLSGGGLLNDGTATLTNVTMWGNEATRGGGLNNSINATATLTNVTIYGNEASFGGGIRNEGTLELSNSTLSGNYASNGGGISNLDALTLVNSIVAGNFAAGPGPDIRNAGGYASVTYSGVNVFSQAGVGDAQDIFESDVANIFASVVSLDFDGPGGYSPFLAGELADNGGPVKTIAILQGGAADGTGSNAALPQDPHDLDGDGVVNEALPVDARGGQRVVGANVDVGAFEAGQLIVTTLDDEDAGTVDLAAELADGNGLSLREAVEIALFNSDPDRITFSTALAGGTVLLDDTLGELAIRNTTIVGDTDGDGAPNIGVFAATGARVFHVIDGTATLESLIIAGGDVGTGVGGGIYVRPGTELTVVNTTMFANSADLGGAIYNGGTLTLVNSTLAGNDATSEGGGLYNAGTATLTNVTLANNAANFGGGMRNAGTATITNTTVSGNVASDFAGIYNGPGADLTLANSIVLGHVVPGNFPELYNSPTGTLTYAGVNIVGLGGDDDPDGGVMNAPSVDAVFAHVGYSGGGQLADNGGPVPTIALNPDATNLAFDSGLAARLDETAVGIDLNGDGVIAGTITTDARGFPRVAGTGVDLGALEQQAGASFEVTTLADELDSSASNATITDMGGLADLSLREALFLAQQDPTSVDDITFASTIVGGVTPDDNGEIVLTQGELAVFGSVNIDGDVGTNGTIDITLRADPLNPSAVFHFYQGISTLNGVTVTGGDAGYGAGVSVGAYLYGGIAAVTILNSEISGNTALYGGGISVDTDSSLRLVNSTVSGNQADIGGGIAVNDGATLTVISSTISDNHADLIVPVPSGYGGGIAVNAGGQATLINSTVSGNTALYGGGIYNGGFLTLINTTLANNSAEYGGGIYNTIPLCGCGGVASLFNSTVSGNYAAESGGGIYHADGIFNLTNTIVAGNSAGYGYVDVFLGGPANYAGVNVFSQAGVGTPLVDIYEANLANIFAAIDPVYGGGQLANNGGPVQTIAIRRGPQGVAHDAGDNTQLRQDTEDLDGDNDVLELIPFDARGTGCDRVIDGDVDVGAFEVQDGPPNGATAGGTIQYVEDQAPTALDPALTVSDPGGFLTGATIAITGNFAAGQDVLGFTNQSGITGSFNAATGVLTLTGLATDAQYQAALRTVTYSNTSQNPSNAARTVNFQVDDGGGLVDIGNVGVNVIPVLDTPGDINGDHTTDIVWRSDDGTVALWEMDGVNVLANTGIATQPTTWDIIDTNGDYDGDGNSDILWRDDTGGVVLWTMDGPNILAETEVAGPIADYWQVADTGDFNGDGRADILWRDDAGRVVLWEMNGADIVDNTLVADVLPSWQLHDSADFNGDGRNDLLWRDDDQNIRIWLMDGATRVSDRIVASLPDYWGFAATGDFNGDARYDILWRDDAGTVVMWEMDGTSITDNTALGTIREYWQIADTGDYDGDLNHDILWRDTTGTVVLWQMDGPTILDSSAVNTIDPRWHIEG